MRSYVVTLILVIALSCQLLASVWSLHRANQQFAASNERALASAVSQIKVQAIRLATNTGHISGFPDFGLWTQSYEAPGACLRFHSHLDDAIYHACKGADLTLQAPDWFAWLYGQLFNIRPPAEQLIEYRDQSYGSLSLRPSQTVAIAQSWSAFRDVTTLSLTVILTTSVLMLFAMNIVIRPSRQIEKGIRALSNDLTAPRIAESHITEWQTISRAINDFAQRLQSSLYRSQSLTKQLVSAQEDERRYISRELHDDLGQSLTGMLALSSLLSVKAENTSPELVDIAHKMTLTTQEMMDQLRNILLSLRLTDSNEPELDKSLQRLIHSWNTRVTNSLQLHYHNAADLSNLHSTLRLNLFRIIQECLNNIYKHSGATDASVIIDQQSDNGQLEVIITDNGSTRQLDFVKSPGFGISGIFERVALLNGNIDFALASPHGLVIKIRIPFISDDTEPANAAK